MTINGNYNPSIIIHELVSGNTYTGVASNGNLDTVQASSPYYTGRVNFFGLGTSGGLIESYDEIGFSLDSIVYKGAGTTRVVISIESELYPSSNPVAFESIIFDTNNQTSDHGAIDPTSFVYSPNRTFFVPPKCRIKVVSTGNLTANGRLEFRLSDGWNYLPMQGLN